MASQLPQDGGKNSEDLTLAFKAQHELLSLLPPRPISYPLPFIYSTTVQTTFFAITQTYQSTFPPQGLCTAIPFAQNPLSLEISAWFILSPHWSLCLNFTSITKTFSIHLIQNNSHIQQYHTGTRISLIIPSSISINIHCLILTYVSS